MKLIEVLDFNVHGFPALLIYMKNESIVLIFFRAPWQMLGKDEG